jgi:hypothetical protein
MNLLGIKCISSIKSLENNQQNCATCNTLKKVTELNGHPKKLHIILHYKKGVLKHSRALNALGIRLFLCNQP